jgi:hypothetical protein
MLDKLDFDFVITLLGVAHEVRSNNIAFEAFECDFDNAKMHKYELIDPLLANEFKKVELLVDAFNNGNPVSRIDELFYQLSDGVIRYTDGQICILTNPKYIPSRDSKVLEE